MFGTFTLTTAALTGLSYLLGSLPTAVLVCHFMGIADPRQQGSHNPGATNVLRIGNKVAASVTLLGDVGKGALAIFVANRFELPPQHVGLCALAAVLGHLFPIAGFRHGGKGIATTLGCCLMLSWPIGLCQLIIWLTAILTTRISSLAGIMMALITPLLAFIFLPVLAATLTLISLLLIARHRNNLKNLLRRDESRF